MCIALSDTPVCLVLTRLFNKLSFHLNISRSYFRRTFTRAIIRRHCRAPPRKAHDMSCWLTNWNNATRYISRAVDHKSDPRTFELSWATIWTDPRLHHRKPETASFVVHWNQHRFLFLVSLLALTTTNFAYRQSNDRKFHFYCQIASAIDSTLCAHTFYTSSLDTR